MVGLAHLVAVGVVLVGVVAVVSSPVGLTHRTVLAAAPWTVTAATVVAARRAGIHAGLTVSTTVVVAGIAGAALGIWVLFSELAALRGFPFGDRYLVASGIGAAVVVAAALVGTLEGVDPSRIVWIALAPVLAAVLAAFGYFLLGLVYTEALFAFQVTGLYVVWTIVFDGAASVAASTVDGGEAGLLTEASLLVLGVEPSPWLVLPLLALLGVAVVGWCGWLARLYGPAGYGFALGLSTLSLGSGTVVLLSATLLG